MSLPAIFTDAKDPSLVVEAKLIALEPDEFTYTSRDVVLYNLGIGANPNVERDLEWTYEGHDEFGALPTFGVIPQFGATASVPLGWLPNFNPVRVYPFSPVCFGSC